MNKIDLLPYLQSIYKEALELGEGSRKEARRAYEYLEGNQLPEDVKYILAERGQPERWENILEDIDDAIEGMKLLTRQEINVFERNVANKDRASIITKVLRSALDSTDWWEEKKRSDIDLRVAGFTAIETTVKPIDDFDSKGVRHYELVHTHLPFAECLIDMYARKPDMSDMRYFHHTRLMFKQELIAVFGKKAESLSEDKRGMVRVHRTWYKSNQKRYIAIWADGIILENKLMPYTHLDGFNVAVRKLKYTQKKEYYGIYRNILPFQDSINNLMLRVINKIGSTKMLVESSAVDDIDEFQQSYGMDDSVTEVNDGALKQGRFKEINTQADIAQIMQLVERERRNAQKINPELMGLSTTRQSGKALQNKQNAGSVILQNYMSVSTSIDIATAKISTALIAQYFNAEQVLSISDTKKEDIEYFIVNEYERDSSGRMIYEEGQPKQKNILSMGRYDFKFKSLPYVYGASDEKMRSWAEIMKMLPPEVVQALIPSMLRDTDSSEAKEAQRVIESLQAQVRQQQQPQGD